MLSKEKRKPRRVVDTLLPAREAGELALTVPQWTLSGKQIEREFRFKDFRQAMTFVNGVADAANKRDYHPDIYISYSRVRLTHSTHKISGLSRNDFILAEEVDRLADDLVHT